MIFEITNQVRVTDIQQGQRWYEILLNKKPDFIPHEGFASNGRSYLVVGYKLLKECLLKVVDLYV